MEKTDPNILVFASGTKTGGGSGFETLVRATQAEPPILDACICRVVTNHPEGGVRQKAKAFGIPVEYWPGPYDAPGYRNFVAHFQAEYVMLSGWLKLVAGLDPARTINIHPGPLPRFGGAKMHGRLVHEAVLAAYHRGEITHTAVTMHFVDDVAEPLGASPAGEDPGEVRSRVFPDQRGADRRASMMRSAADAPAPNP